MGEWSKSAYTEHMSRKDRWRVEGVRMVINAFQRHTQEPFPAMSDHYRAPEEPSTDPQQLVLEGMEDPIKTEITEATRDV